ncbi:hypothetical protein P8C59_000812 [Phyllachora maydis]|uniref:DHHA2 domain-containing protein n=1 Tax=Phyllachora maydis TaxID=1825666 RepID=A0AAD9HWX1_9PEZI|nr:hypothetical protein P8C59_000812 [Phyllachora maydis]
MPRTSLSAFLATARQALHATQTANSSMLTFVVGNEAADLDSLCSALVLAYLRTAVHNSAGLHIPLANLPRADLALRPELRVVLGRAGLAPDDLLTLDDLPAAAHLPPARTRWLLVDHNALTGPLAARGFAARVVGCVDHHDDEGAVPPAQQGWPRVIETCGSCASLVVRECRAAWEEAASRARADDDDDDDVDRALAYVALGPVLADTLALGARDKTTETDAWAVAFLEGLLGTRARPSDHDRAGYLASISRLQRDLAGLRPRDVLRKDYKRWTEAGLHLGVSAAARGLDELAAAAGGRAALLRAVRAWAAEQGLDVVAVMTAAVRADGGLARELLLWGLRGGGVAAAERFAAEQVVRLGLEPYGHGALDRDPNGDGDGDGDGDGHGCEEWRRCWTQRRVENSRKQMAPLLRAAMRDVGATRKPC